MAIVTQSDMEQIRSEAEQGQVLTLYILFRDKLEQSKNAKKWRGFDLNKDRIINGAITAAENYNSILKSQAFEVERGKKPTPTQETIRFKNILVPTKDSGTEKEMVAQIARYCILTEDAARREKEKQQWEAEKDARIRSYFAPSKGLYPEMAAAGTIGVISVGMYSMIAGISLVAALSGPIGIGLLAGAAVLAFCAIQIAKYQSIKKVLSEEGSSQDKALAKIEEAVKAVERSFVVNVYQKNHNESYQSATLDQSYQERMGLQAVIPATTMPKRSKSLPIKISKKAVESSNRSTSAPATEHVEMTRYQKK